MGTEQPNVVELIVACLRDVVDEPEKASALGVNTALIGPDSVLDSIRLVQLLVEVEQRVEQEHGITVQLTDERALTQEKSPFRSVAALAEYAGMLIDEQRSAAGAQALRSV